MDEIKLEQGGEVIGSVTVRKEGLYFHFSCRCDLCGEVMYQLFVRTEDQPICLGLLVPMDGRFGLERRIPVKQIGAENMLFFLRPKHDPVTGDLYPVHPEEPFAYLNRLEQAYLVRREGQWGLVLRNEK